jgi:prepilin-type N-terminal cleavage/methylation domain-containing protein
MKRRTKAFTLMEMLVVISIIVLLISLVQPSLRAAKESARDVKCRSQLHQIGLAFISLSDDARGRLPGLWGPPWTGPEAIQGSFMGKEVFQPYYLPSPVATKQGTLVPYIGGEEAARQSYRCPSLAVGVFRSGIGSNGMFDYTMMQALPGALVAKLPQTATYIAPGSGETVTTPIPIVIEEDPAFGINKDFVDMGHTSINRFGTTHFGNGGNYMTAGGAALRLTFAATPGPEGYAWTAKGKGGNVSLGIAQNYGGWD